jgi:hypothetical protein
MKTLSYVTAIGLVLLIASATPAQSQEDYTFVANAWGPQICLGVWTPSSDIGKPGVCEGQMMGLPQLTAISAKQTVDRLDQLLAAFASVDEKLDINNKQVSMLIEATYETQASIDQQVKQTGEFLSEAIKQRFDAIPKEILANKAFLKELLKLREDILQEVEKRYPAAPPPSTK